MGGETKKKKYNRIHRHARHTRIRCIYTYYNIIILSTAHGPTTAQYECTHIRDTGISRKRYRAVCRRRLNNCDCGVVKKYFYRTILDVILNRLVF